jgi:vacuolar-type H+-ATPase subunit I/STV1
MSLKALKRWRIWHWSILGLNLFSLVFGLLTGGHFWWVSIFGVAVMIAALHNNRKSMKLVTVRQHNM